MKQSFFVLSFALFVLGQPAFALLLSDQYYDGPTTCKNNFAFRNNQHEIWLSVPIDYKNLEKGSTPLYAWTKKPFDQQKKTVVFVAGGPGDTSHHSSFDLDDWNVVLFDQRGNSCSKPLSKELHLDPNFYSSENTARDIEEIRKHLGVSKISVYGVSYGTIPAHLYGHFFPESTRATVIEGVIYEGGSDLIDPLRRVKLLQRFFDSLPVDMQNRILEISQNPDIPANWFSNVGAMMLYMDNPTTPFRSFLDNILWDDNALKAVLPSFSKTEPQEFDFGFSHVMMGMIGCKELGMNLSTASFSAIFKNRTLESDRISTSNKFYCEPLGFQKDDSTKLFSAKKYPTKVPVTYIQGTQDGATVATQAIKHFKNVSQGFSQLILVKNGGHAPLHGALSSGYESGDAVSLRSDILKAALNGQNAEETKLKKLSEITSLNWLLVTK